MNPEISEIYLETYDLKKTQDTLEKYGVVVLLNYFSKDQAETWKSDLIKWLGDLSPALNVKDTTTWCPKNMPYGPRPGMMQSLVSHAPTVFEIREAMYPLFKDLWDTEKLYCSLDGASVHPPIYETKRAKDWPHIDQTRTDVKCIQGQVVLSESTATFRCTPKSHLKHQEIIELCAKEGDTSNWCKFNQLQLKVIQPMFDKWQLPIYSPPGSVILWYSNTIHSAARNQKKDKGWRAVVYVSMRPTEQYTTQNKSTLRKAAISGRTTNHWGSNTFPKRPGFYMQDRRSDAIEVLTDHPEQLVPEHTPLMQKLLALEEW